MLGGGLYELTSGVQRERIVCATPVGAVQKVRPEPGSSEF
jgi:hypothetical protein